ncbi:MAG: phenylalanine--tRNA ligase subunit alpha [SAR202 cluster bacterium]|nr:MAG: phenylalanine--tRNA ligase subunit alpha [SAR202 cluster bacterium]MQF64232.1 phenylalanine--tRNA ligase subunit alpha [SAR202 cluster bacterium AD-802-L14_MRT_200m]GIT19333.1 MAG: phenylalanine--tRNA ligase alpha subunit [Dehalococcoidia bacterium]KAA1298645.1 MAG: phenylalanine--tRNA ligase subunit alpha [SAR202 cluster bacterium]KAA1303323.1 MAG: phenylalanine--tRNA ligase subunit alpha [SAR202 cluster bacterium]
MSEVQPGESVEQLREAAVSALNSADSSDQIESWRVDFLGRKGRLTALLRGLGSLEIEERKIVGAAANLLRADLDSLYEKREREARSSDVPAGSLDVTLPGRKPALGGLHPSTQMIREITQAFNEMGFQTVEGPEVELEKYNFDMLNIPAGHPARDQWDTIWVDSEKYDDVLLRTHTSPMQARVMENNDPPIRVVVPGKCYRYESTDSTHEWHFNQVEGLAVDEGITFADLKGTLYEFARRIFGQSRKVRFRCDFFPFVEPGVDMSIDWNGRWIEILGAGMVHPRVLENSGYDASKYTGFAFGMGPERISMLRNEITDIRHFFSNDLRFLTQF